MLPKISSGTPEMKYLARVLKSGLDHPAEKIVAPTLASILNSVGGDEERVLRVWENERFTVPYSRVGAAAIVERTENWGVDAIAAGRFWERGFLGEGINVGIADSGLDKSHSVFEHTNLINFADFSLETGEIVGDDPYDSGWHGTHCASILAGAESDSMGRGVAPQCNLFVAKVLDGWDGSVLSVSKALRWFVENDCDVVSLSIGNPGTHDVWFEEMLDLVSSGCVAIVAAGNEYGEAYPTRSPGNYGIDGTISVGASKSDQGIWHRSGGGVVSWPSIGGAASRDVLVPDIVAPGAAIAGASPNHEYRVESGTSMATPHIAGLAALAIQRSRSAGYEITPDELKRVMLESCSDLGEPGADTRYGAGLFSGELLFDKLGEILSH